jgi:hypothetical protein
VAVGSTIVSIVCSLLVRGCCFDRLYLQTGLPYHYWMPLESSLPDVLTPTLICARPYISTGNTSSPHTLSALTFTKFLTPLTISSSSPFFCVSTFTHFEVTLLETSIAYTVDVRQGDTILPALLQFLMPAVMESLHIRWNDSDLEHVVFFQDTVGCSADGLTGSLLRNVDLLCSIDSSISFIHTNASL